MVTHINGKIKKIAVGLKHETYEAFNKKARGEGYSMQYALQLLVRHYINDNLVPKSEISSETK